jgi:hypothetical protein
VKSAFFWDVEPRSRCTEVSVERIASFFRVERIRELETMDTSVITPEDVGPSETMGL